MASLFDIKQCPEIPLDLSLPEEGNSTVDEARIWLSEVFANTSQALTELSDGKLWYIVFLAY